MRRSSAFLGFVTVVLFGLSGCGSSKSPSGGVDGSRQLGGQTSASTATGQGGSQGTSTGAAGAGPGGSTSSVAGSAIGGGGGGAGGTQASTVPVDAGVPDAPVLGGHSGTGGDHSDAGGSGSLGGSSAGVGGSTSTGGRPADAGISADAPDATVFCPGLNPAEARCRASATACVPSTCVCSVGNRWQCTGDCRANLPVCPDAGVATDARPDSGGTGIPCGNTFCSGGEYCCNANCSTCVREGVDCALVLCEPPTEWTCASDSDCKAVDDYCGGCNCRAMGPKGQLGTCTTELVSCITAPCTTKKARCENRQCVLVTK